MFDAVDVEEARVLLVAERGVHENEAVGVLDQQAAHGQRDPVTLVRRRAGLPQEARDHAEHGPSIQPLAPALQRVAAQPADLERVGEASRPLAQAVHPRLGRGGHPLPAAPPRSAEGDGREVLQSRGALLACEAEQPREQVGGHQGVAGGAGGGVSEALGQVVEPAGTDALHQRCASRT